MVAAGRSNQGSPSLFDQIWSYVVFNGTFLFIISLNVLLLAGLWYYPYQVGLYILLPYVSYTRLFSQAEKLKGSSSTGGSARWKYFTRHFFILRQMRKHFQLGFHQPLPESLVQAEKKPGAQFLFATFPHGVASDYRIAMDGIMHTVFPNIHNQISVLAASVLFAIPICREMALWTGCINANRQVAERALKKGCSILVLPGGEAEQIRTQYGKEEVYLKTRKGFVKLAMKHQIPIVPSYVFGVSDYYYTSQILFGPRLWLQKTLGICIPLATGLGGSIFCPFGIQTTVVYGEPMTFLTKIKGSPTSEELDAAHSKFCTALVHLFDAHKQELGYGDLEIY